MPRPIAIALTHSVALLCARFCMYVTHPTDIIANCTCMLICNLWRMVRRAAATAVGHFCIKKKIYFVGVTLALKALECAEHIFRYTRYILFAILLYFLKCFMYLGAMSHICHN